MEQLADVYSSLFAQTTTQNDETAPLSHRNTHYPKTLLQKYGGRSAVLLQLSIYRKLFSLSIPNAVQNHEDLHDKSPSKMAVSCTMGSWRLDLCKDLATEAESVINIMVGHLMSGDQFISFAAGKALMSFIMYIYIVTDSQSIEVFLKWISHLISVETFQTHVAVYTLQTFIDVLKAVRKTSNKVQGSATSLWECVIGLIKDSLQLFERVKELYKQLVKEKEEDRNCRMKWMELSVDILLCLSIEALHVCHTNTSVDHTNTSVDHMTTNYECRKLIHRNLLELTSFLDFSQSIYVLKEVIRLIQKILTGSFPQEYDSVPIRSSVLKLFRSDIFTRTARQSWLGRFISPTKTNTEVQALDTTIQSAMLHSSMTEINEKDLTLESSLISTITRNGVLLLLRYSASVLKKSTWTAGCVQLEELLSSVAQQLCLPAIVDPSQSTIATAQHQLLELLSDQDTCLIEGLLLSCNITTVLRENSSIVSPSAHPTLSMCLRLVHIHSLFVEFLSSFIFFDHSILIDYFISSETSTTFRQFLSQYLSLAASDWMAVVRACKELDDGNNEIIPADPNKLSISEDKDCQLVERHSQTLCQGKITVKHPEQFLASVLQSCEEVDSRNELETITTDSHTSRLTSFSKTGKDCSNYVNEDDPTSLNIEWTPVKRPKLDPHSNLPADDDTAMARAKSSHPGSSVAEKYSLDIKFMDSSVSSKESSNSHTEEELESSGSVHMEASLDKMMDCLTKFKYSLQRLHSRQLLQPVEESDTALPMDSTFESIVNTYEQLEDFYEAMEKQLL